MIPIIIEEDEISRVLECPVCKKHERIYKDDYRLEIYYSKTCIPHVECKKENRRALVRRNQKQYYKKLKNGEVMRFAKKLKKAIENGTAIKRECLKCGKMFMSESRFNRLCIFCKKSNEGFEYKRQKSTNHMFSETDEQLIKNFITFG